MKKNLTRFLGVTSLGMGAALLALIACTSASRAGIIVDNTTGNGNATVSSFSSVPFAQVFTMSGTGGNLSSLTLELNSTLGGTAGVDLWSVSAGAPNVLLQNLGTVTAGTSGDNQLIAVSSLVNYSLTAGTQYAIVLQSSSSIEWDATLNSSASGSGTIGSPYSFFGGSWHPFVSGNFQMEVDAVPEVPITGAVMGFGALAIAMGGILRRKLRPAVTSIV